MTQLAHIKTRIATIQKTQKITTAMRLIAMSFYSRLEKQKNILNAYRSTVLELTPLLFTEHASVPAGYRTLIQPTKEHTDHTPLVIVCSSAKGLCGGLNNNLIRFFERTLIAPKAGKPSFIALGNKACAYLDNGRHGNVIARFPEYHLNTLPTVVQSIVQAIVTAPKPYSSVTIFYTHLKNFFMQIPTEKAILPLAKNSSEGSPEATTLPNKDNALWEQNPAALGSTIFEYYLATEFTHAFFNNLISENAARFIAMDQSTNNATRYLEMLHLAYNKSRQNTITREIAELAGSFE